MSSSFHASYSNHHATTPGLQPSPVRMRERSSPRKQRPASVGTSMPSFVGGEPAKSMSASRSKSSDRMARDRSKTRPSRRKDKTVSKETPTSKGKEKKEETEDEKDGGTGTAKKGRVSLSFFDRLSTPKFHRKQDDQKDAPPKKESPIVRKSSFRDKTKADLSSSTPRHVAHRDSSTSSPRTAGGSSVSPAPTAMSKSITASPRITPPLSSSASASPHPTPSISVTSHSNAPAPSSEDGTATPRGGTNQDISEEAYKAKMAERRRQAREKAEREAEEERKRQEEERLAEEERLHQEEEEQLRLEEETIRLAEEARKAEEERLQRAIEAEEKRKKDEAERLEQERKAKEEAERKAREEAERIEREKQEKAKKDEEERQERKKKLEMIMKRVKTDPAHDTKMESPVRSSANSPNRSALASPEVQEMPPFAQEQDNSSGSEDGNGKLKDPPVLSMSENARDSGNSSEPALTPVVRSASSGDIIDSTAEEEKKEMEKGDSLGSLNTPVKPANGTTSESTPSSSTEVKSRFKSPLLQQLVENKGGSDSPGTPKFKSPLLQNLLGKTKVGARMGLSASMGDLSLNKDKDNHSTTAATTTTTTIGTNQQQSSSPSLSPASSSKEISKAGQDEDKDVDESVASSSSITPSSSTSSNGQQESFKPQSLDSHLSNGVGKSDGEGEEESGRYDSAMTRSSPPGFSPQENKISPMSMMIDSALGSSIEPQGDLELSAAGSVMSNGHGKNKQDTMGDSSISLQSPDEEKTIATSDQYHYQSGQSSSQEETEEEEEDEERGGRSDGRFEELIDLPYTSNNSSKASVTPIIAFEENSLRTADVGESMS